MACMRVAGELSGSSLVTGLCREGQADETIVSLERAVALTPGDPLIAADLGYCYAVSGQRDKAQAISARMWRRRAKP